MQGLWYWAVKEALEAYPSTSSGIPSSRIKWNHPPKVIMGNINELTLRKCTAEKYVANFISCSCYLSQVEPAKVEDFLQDES